MEASMIIKSQLSEEDVREALREYLYSKGVVSKNDSLQFDYLYESFGDNIGGYTIEVKGEI